MGQTIEATFTPTKPETIMNLVGINDANLRLIEESYDVQVTDTGSEIEVTGEESIVKKIMQIFTALDKVVTRGVTITATDVVSAIKMADKGTLEFFGELYNKILIRDAKGRPVRVKNMGQKRYIEAIQKYDVVFGIGPAGTGKTFLRSEEPSLPRPQAQNHTLLKSLAKFADSSLLIFCPPISINIRPKTS